MRIKFNDKIYRLKEIESGVDSLMELVEEPKYKEGDFLHSDWCGANITIIYRKRNGDDLFYHASKSNCIGLSFEKEMYWPNNGDFRLATESEKKELIDALSGIGKRWNAEKKCIEDISVYKDGDFVVNDSGSILIFKEAKGNHIFDHAFLYNNGTFIGVLITNEGSSLIDIKRHATTKEKQRIIDALAKKGKRWNEEKKCVEDMPKQKYKEGDFLTTVSGRCFILKNICGSKVYDHAFLVEDGLDWDNGHCCYLDDIAGYCTPEEILKVIAALKKEGKRWNEEEKCIEEIPVRKFKKGDKIRIKEGVSSKTHGRQSPRFAPEMDDLIGKTMTIELYCDRDIVLCEKLHWRFKEDWLEPWSDEPKVGDWVIAWNNDMSLAVIGVKINATPMPACKHVLNNNNSYKYAVKFNGTRDHLEKIRSGKV